LKPRRQRKSTKTSPKLVFDSERPDINIPDGFTMIMDTREQIALFEPQNWIIDKGLKTGDFSILGFEDAITIERKSLPDLFGTLGKGRERFEKEIVRMKKMNWYGMMIEGSEDDTMREQEWSTMVVNQIYHALSSYQIQGLHIYYAGSKGRARDWVLSRLTRWYEHMREGRIVL